MYRGVRVHRLPERRDRQGARPRAAEEAPRRAVEEGRAAEEAPQGVVTDRDGARDGDVLPTAPGHAREIDQVEAERLHCRDHGGDGAAAVHSFGLTSFRTSRIRDVGRAACAPEKRIRLLGRDHRLPCAP